jgi:hypothetical protein
LQYKFAVLGIDRLGSRVDRRAAEHRRDRAVIAPEPMERNMTNHRKVAM